MKPSVYIESSVISYLAAHPSRDVVVAGRQAITHDWRANINNAETKAANAKLIESRGVVCPQLCSPEELGGNDND